MSVNIVTIIGRVNVGKSTLFNRLLEKRKALTSPIPGTTRDINSGEVSWRGLIFKLIDSGGLIDLNFNSSRGAVNSLNRLIAKKAKEALEKSQIILFVVDAQAGLNVQDRLIAQFLKKNYANVILVANKCDNPGISLSIFEFNKLGFGDPLPVSAINGSGSGDLLDVITGSLLKKGLKETPSNGPTADVLPKICLLGKPNVGKSTLLNKILGEDKVIVSPVPHTTREPHDELVDLAGEKAIIIDTVGVRRRRSIPPQGLEKIGVSLTLKTLDEADLALLVLDAGAPLTDQDLKLGQLIANADNLSVIIIANKWDMAKEKSADKNDQEKIAAAKKYILYFNQSFPHLYYAPVVFISALTGKNVKSLIALIKQVLANRQALITDNALDKLLKKTIKKYGGPRFRNLKGRVKKTFIKSLTQKDVNPPVFSLKIFADQKLVPAYLSYLKKELYEKFDFSGTPLKIVVEKDAKSTPN